MLVFVSLNSAPQLKYHTEQTTDSSADRVGCTVHDNGLHAGDTRLGNEWRDAIWSILSPQDCVHIYERGRTAVGDNTGNDQCHWKLLSTLVGKLSHQFNFLCMFHVYLQSRTTLWYVQWLQWRESLYYWSVEQGGKVFLLLTPTLQGSEVTCNINFT